MPMPRFDYSFNLGHLLTIVTMVLPFFTWIIVTDASYDRRLSVLEQTVHVLADTAQGEDLRTREAIAQLDTRMREADAESRAGLRQIDDKISALLLKQSELPPVAIPARPGVR